MENNLISILMESDPERLERKARRDIEIKRLSEVLVTPFVLTFKAIPG